MQPSIPHAQLAFARLLRVYQTGGIGLEDMLAELDQSLMAGAVRTELLEALRRRESVEPLADAVYLSIWSRLRRAPHAAAVAHETATEPRVATAEQLTAV